MSEKKNKGWPKLGNIVKGENGSYIQLDKDVTILKGGVEVQIHTTEKGNRNLQLQCPVKNTQRLIELGVIDNKDAESRLEKAQEVKKWLNYEIVLPPPRNG